MSETPSDAGALRAPDAGSRRERGRRPRTRADGGAALLERLIEPQTFTSLGAASWWAIATVSTTGYGDVVPTTTPGRVVAAVVMVSSLALVPAVTAIVTTLLVKKHEAELGRANVVDLREARLAELVERLDRTERRLAESAPGDAEPPRLSGPRAPRAAAPHRLRTP